MVNTKYWFALSFSFLATSPLWKDLMFMTFNKRTTNDKMRTIIITGATGNQGKALTMQLARRHCRLILACRDMKKCKILRREAIIKTGNRGILCKYLNLEDLDSINNFADEVINDEPHIDILINNAAIKELKDRELTKYGIEKMYFVNFLAPFLLTLRLEKKMSEASRITRDCRVVNVLSKKIDNCVLDLNDINFEKIGYSSEAAYLRSKLALAHFTILFDKLCHEKENHIYVFGTTPALKSTSIAESLQRPSTIKDTFIRWIQTFYLWDPELLVQTVIRCSLDHSLNNRQNSGQLYSYFSSSWGWGKACQDETKGKLIWNHAADTLLKISDENQPKIGPE